MQAGTCALCGIVGKLHNSHFVPKSIYRHQRQGFEEILRIPIHPLPPVAALCHAIELLWAEVT